jgi:hypothetical protein
VHVQDAPETIALIRDMAARGRLWGAERIRGELLKVGNQVSKRTIEKYMRGVRNRGGGGGQKLGDLLRNHTERTWVCDFIQTHDHLFHPVYAFFLVHRRALTGSTYMAASALSRSAFRSATFSRPMLSLTMRAP